MITHILKFHVNYCRLIHSIISEIVLEFLIWLALFGIVKEDHMLTA